MRATVLLAAVLLPRWSAEASSFVYISISGENRIAVYRMDSTSGQLTHEHDLSVPGAPGGMAVDPDRNFLFVALRSINSLASFKINASNGELTPLRVVNAEGSAAYVATDRTGRYLMSAYYREGKVGVHKIDADGQLNPRALQWIETAERAHAILPDLTNRFVLVPHTRPNAIFQFLFDEQTGRLSANSPDRFRTPSESEPRHVVFHPNGRFVYVDNEKGDSVTAFQLDQQKGILSPIGTWSTIPPDFQKNNSCADIELAPSGQFLYASNRGHDSIACFQVDLESGELTAIEQVPTQQTPRSFNIDPSGRFLFAAGQGSGKLAAYRMDASSGRLEPLAVYEVGASPAWVQVVNPGR